MQPGARASGEEETLAGSHCLVILRLLLPGLFNTPGIAQGMS
jgi:hypothetical protein